MFALLKLKPMKKNYIPMLILLLVITTSVNSNAQKSDKSNKQVTIKIVSEEDGKKTVIDTTFTTADDVSIEAFLKDKGIKSQNPPAPPIPPTPPSPPAPPKHRTSSDQDENQSKYEYSYKVDDNGDHKEINISIDMDKIERALEEADRQLEDAFNKSASLTKEEIRKIKKEVEASLKELKSDIKANHKYIIIETTKKTTKKDENETK